MVEYNAEQYGCFILRIVTDVFFPLRRVHPSDCNRVPSHVTLLNRRRATSLLAPRCDRWMQPAVSDEKLQLDAETCTNAFPTCILPILDQHSANMGSLLAVAASPAGKRRRSARTAACT
jgi:hypothetical protein